jgi:hypothetical protein
MKTRQSFVRGLMGASIVSAGLTGTSFAQDSTPPAHVHLGHVATQFRGTPDGAGLLPTAIAEAETALQHATLAARDPGDLDAIRRHANHVLHALSPDKVERGPGLGYGVTLAAERTAHYVELAMAADGGGDALSTHGPHVTTATRNALATTEHAVELATALAKDEDLASASARLEELVTACEAILNGVDANGDGRIGWQEGEGGLAQAAQHLELLRRGEGLIG